MQGKAGQISIHPEYYHIKAVRSPVYVSGTAILHIYRISIDLTETTSFKGVTGSKSKKLSGFPGCVMMMHFQPHPQDI